MMKKAALFIFVFIGIVIFAGEAYAPLGTTGRSSGKAPEVRYIAPRDDSEVDLTDKENLTFRWKPTPKPSSGRRAYKFTLFKDFSYDVILKKELDRDVYSIEVPSDKFEDSQMYSWQVKQRPRYGGDWSRDLRWSFKVKK